MNFLMIYGIGVIFTTICILGAFLFFLITDVTLKRSWKDLWLSILSIIGWPIFWLLIFSSYFSESEVR